MRARTRRERDEGVMPHGTADEVKAENGLARSFRCAAEGLATASCERNFRIDLAFAAGALVLAAVLRVEAWGWVAILLCIGGVIAFETMNTAVEAAVDLASPDLHPLAKRAKDCAAGACLAVACASVAVGLVVYAHALARLLA